VKLEDYVSYSSDEEIEFTSNPFATTQKNKKKQEKGKAKAKQELETARKRVFENIQELKDFRAAISFFQRSFDSMLQKAISNRFDHEVVRFKLKVPHTIFKYLKFIKHSDLFVLNSDPTFYITKKGTLRSASQSKSGTVTAVYIMSKTVNGVVVYPKKNFIKNIVFLFELKNKIKLKIKF